MGLAAAREIGRQRSASARLRRRAVVVAAAALAAAALLAVAVADLDDDAARELVPYLAQSGLRGGAALAATLLVLPALALLRQALRVGALEARRRHRALAVAGAAPRDLRLLGGLEDARLFALGGAAAGPCYLLLWLVLGVAPVTGSRVVPPPGPALVLAWPVLVLALTAAGALVGARSAAGVLRGARRGRPLRPRPAAVRAAVASAALVALTTAVLVVDDSAPLGGTPLLLVVGGLLVLVALTAGALGAAAAARAALRPRSGDPAVDALAAAQLRGDPAAAGRLAGVLALCGLGVGVEAALVRDVLATTGEDASFYVGGALLAGAVGGAAALVALVSAALAVTDHLLTARRSVAAVAALGAPTRRLGAVQARVLHRTAVPSVAVGAAAGGLFYGTPFLVVAGPAAWEALAVLVLTTAAAAALTAAACRGVALLLVGRVRRASAVGHLRTP